MSAKPENKIVKIDRCLKRAAMRHENIDTSKKRLDELAIEFVKLHGEPAGSVEADELMHCILDEENRPTYKETMERILKWKLQKINGMTPSQRR